MAPTTNFSVRMDADIKKKCEALYGERQSLRSGGFPFDVRMDRPNQETVAAMLEAERLISDPSVKRWNDVEDALTELKR